MTTMMTVSRQAVAWLAAGQINQLSYEEPCCSNCCAPCGAIMEMVADGTLDEALVEFGPGYDWWDESASKVNRAWLAARIKPSHFNVSNGVKEYCTEPDAMSQSFTP